MKKLVAIGEALVDFIPQTGSVPIKQVDGFSPIVGGAPANVCGAFRKLGGESEMITQLGNDPFGDKIIDEFDKYGIGHKYISRTDEANTSLAFVALREDGDREFSFYRNPGADMLLSKDKIKEEWFNDIFGLHFCSVSLGDFPMREAHERAIEYASSKKALISFDPNVRPALWKDKELLRRRIRQFMGKCDIIKISDEELEFITGEKHIKEALPQIFVGRVKMVVLTKGSNGAEAYTKYACAKSGGVRVEAVDTTGAGDAFVGSMLYQLAKDDITVDNIENLSEETMEKYLEFSNRYCAKSVMKHGAIASYPFE